MKKFYIGALAMSSLLVASCAKDNDNIPANEPASIEEKQDLETGVLSFKAEIQTWQEDESFRTLGWDIADASASNESIIPKVKYTQEEFSGAYAPAENTSDLKSLQVPKYFVKDNLINPQYTEISVKLRRPDRNSKGVWQGAKQARFTIWDGRNYSSGIKGGKGVVELKDLENGKQSLEVYLPMADLGKGLGLFDGEWYMALALGGRSGGYNLYEGLTQYYTASGNGTIESLHAGAQTPGNAFVQSGAGPAGSAGGWLMGAYPSFSEPNRLKPGVQSEYASFFTLSSNGNPTSTQAIRKGLGLQEQVGNVTAMKRHFPMMSRFAKVSSSKRNEHAATGQNSANYADVHNIVVEPRGSILAFKLKNPVENGQTIVVKSITGNHGGTFDHILATKEANGATVLRQRDYKAISYQGFYSAGFIGHVSLGGFPEADLKAGQPIPFVGMTIGPETFPLYDANGQEGIRLDAGSTTTGRFYLWFSADPGAVFKIRMTYDVLNPDGTVAQSNLVSEPQTVNPTTKPGFQFQDGKVYGALVQVKPDNPNN